MDCTVHGVAKSWTQLSNFHFHSYIGPYSLIIHHVAFLMFYSNNPSFFFSILPLAEATWEKILKNKISAYTQMMQFVFHIPHEDNKHSFSMIKLQSLFLTAQESRIVPGT